MRDGGCPDDAEAVRLAQLREIVDDAQVQAAGGAMHAALA